MAGEIVRLSYPSRALGRTRQVCLWRPSPPSANPLPVLVLLHGRSQTPRSWLEDGDAAAILVRAMAEGRVPACALVCPDGHAGDADRLANARALERELLDDVLPLCERTWALRTDAAGRAIAGLSMGGAQALVIGLSNPQRFSRVASFSTGTFDPAWVAESLGQPDELNRHLATLWIGCGREDEYFASNQRIAAALDARGVRHTFVPTDGDHDWATWRRLLERSLPELIAPVA